MRKSFIFLILQGALFGVVAGRATENASTPIFFTLVVVNALMIALYGGEKYKEGRNS